MDSSLFSRSGEDNGSIHENSENSYVEEDARLIHYLSLEYLMGRLLNSNLCNLGIRKSLEKEL